MNTRSIIAEPDLKMLFKSLNVSGYKLQEYQPLILQLDVDIEEFAEYARKKGKDIFYYYAYANKENLKITDSLFDEPSNILFRALNEKQISADFGDYLRSTLHHEEYDDEFEAPPSDSDFSQEERKLLKKILAYNEQVDNTEYNIPCEFAAIIIESGTNICIAINTHEYDSVAENQLISILQEITTGEKVDEERIDAREKIREMLLDDSHFHACKNMRLRRDYAREMWKKPENQWMRRHFAMRGNYSKSYVPNEFVEFLERVYNEYKMSL